MKFTQEERAMIHKTLLAAQRAGVMRATAEMISMQPVSEDIKEELNQQANLYDKKTETMLVELFEADSYDQVIDDYTKYLQNS